MNENVEMKEEKIKGKKKEKSSTALKKFQKNIFDADITLAEMLEKTPKFLSKKVIQNFILVFLKKN